MPRLDICSRPTCADLLNRSRSESPAFVCPLPDLWFGLLKGPSHKRGVPRILCGKPSGPAILSPEVFDSVREEDPAHLRGELLDSRFVRKQSSEWCLSRRQRYRESCRVALAAPTTTITALGATITSRLLLPAQRRGKGCTHFFHRLTGFRLPASRFSRSRRSYPSPGGHTPDPRQAHWVASVGAPVLKVKYPVPYAMPTKSHLATLSSSPSSIYSSKHADPSGIVEVSKWPDTRDSAYTKLPRSILFLWRLLSFHWTLFVRRALSLPTLPPCPLPIYPP